MSELAPFVIGVCCAGLPMLAAVVPFAVGYSRRRRTMADVARREAVTAYPLTTNVPSHPDGVRRSVVVALPV